MSKSNNKKKISLVLRNSQEISVHLSSNDASVLIDQIYCVFSGEFDDNCIEIVSDTEIGRETILLKADEVLYVKSQEDVDYE